MKTDVVVIGAGVIGLAAAARLARRRETILLEAHGKFAQETSSRNSEVIHSGIYYPSGSKKTDLCLEGKRALYEYAAANRIPHAACGKVVVATSEGECAYLEKLESHCREIGVEARRLTASEVKTREPLVSAKAGLLLSESGIVDSHAVCAALEREFRAAGGTAAYRHRVRGVSRGKAWVVETNEGAIEADLVVNAAGLEAAQLSNGALSTSRYEHRYCRGRYFGFHRAKFRGLVYPAPEKDGLGIHVTIDLAGNARLGPDVEWCGKPTYHDIDWEAAREKFLTAARRYLADVRNEDLSPGTVGIRPKLFIDGKAHSDFLIENHDGFIHCLGIESPGLTAALAIGRVVEELA